LLNKDFDKYYNTILQEEFNELNDVVYKNFYLEIKDKVLDLSL